MESVEALLSPLVGSLVGSNSCSHRGNMIGILTFALFLKYFIFRLLQVRILFPVSNNTLKNVIYESVMYHNTSKDQST